MTHRKKDSANNNYKKFIHYTCMYECMYMTAKLTVKLSKAVKRVQKWRKITGKEKGENLQLNITLFKVLWKEVSYSEYILKRLSVREIWK